MDNIFRFLHHLTFGYPECGFCDRHGKVIYLDAVKLTDGDLNGITQVHDYLPFMEQRYHFVLQAAQGQVGLREKVARAAGGVYKDAVFDTNRKSLLRHISAEKGLK